MARIGQLVDPLPKIGPGVYRRVAVLDVPAPTDAREIAAQALYLFWTVHVGPVWPELPGQLRILLMDWTQEDLEGAMLQIAETKLIARRGEQLGRKNFRAFQKLLRRWRNRRI